MRNLTIFAIIAYLVLVVGGIVGYVMNVITIINTFDAPLTGMFIARIVGCFIAPIGAVLGYF